MSFTDKFNAMMGDTDAQLKVKAESTAKAQLKEHVTQKKSVKFTSSKKTVGANMFNTIYKLDDGKVVFNLDEPISFYVRNIEFDGPTYHEEQHAESDKVLKKKHHGLAGAVVGGVLTGGLGTIAGAVVGNGMGKDKTRKVKDSSKTMVEDPTNLRLILENVADHSQTIVGLLALQRDYQELLNFQTPLVESEPEPVKPESTTLDQSAIDELTKLKSLLDSGIITQDDFDKKKKQLLGL